MIKIENLHKQYGKKVIYNNFNLTIPNGIVFIIAGNGQGKTTLLNCITNYIHYTGRIKLDSSFVYLSEQRILFLDWSVQDTIDFCNGMKSDGGPISEDVKEYSRMLDFDLTQKIKCSELSKGNYSKLLFLCILMGSENLIILDEPTDGFDIDSQEQFKQILRLMESRGKSIIISTHSYDLIKSFNDKPIIRLEELRRV